MIKGFSQSLLGKVLLKMFGFICLPLLTYQITPNEMGVFQLLFGGMGIFVEIVCLGMRQLYAVDFFKQATLRARLFLLKQNIWVYLRISSVFFLLLFFFLWGYLPVEYRTIAIMAMLYAYLNLFNELYLNTIRYQQKFFHYNSVCLSVGFLQFVLTLGFVLGFKWGLYGLALAYLLTECVTLLLIAVFTSRELKLLYRMPVSASSMRKVLMISFPFIPSILSYWLLMNTDQWMLGKMLGLESVGLLAIALKFALLFDFFVTSTFLLVYTPKAFDLMRVNLYEGMKTNTYVAWGCLLGSFLLGGAVFVAAPVLKYFISENYFASIPLIAPLILAASLRFSSGVLQLSLQYRHQISFLVVANSCAALINGVLNYMMIPYFGIAGCLIATNFSFLCLFIMILWKQQTKEPVLC